VSESATTARLWLDDPRGSSRVAPTIAVGLEPASSSEDAETESRHVGRLWLLLMDTTVRDGPTTSRPFLSKVRLVLCDQAHRPL
jgi:hypothetical protein